MATSIPHVGVISKAIGEVAVPAGLRFRSSEIAAIVEAIVVAASMVSVSENSVKSRESAVTSIVIMSVALPVVVKPVPPSMESVFP